MTRNPRVLIVDLNNFSLYPTMSVGYLVGILRGAGADVEVLAPLAYGIPGIMREPPETLSMNISRQVNYFLAQTQFSPARMIKGAINRTRSRIASRRYPDITKLFARVNPADFDIVMVSTYLMYYPVCVEIGEICEQANVPLVIGGSYFAESEVAQSWLDIPGLTALIGGEIELELVELIGEILNNGDISRFGGVWLPNGNGGARAPLTDLDDIPFPDYSDFPWSKYPSRILPVITGRGCGWGVCTFCSDVTSTAGRGFRSRSPDNVMEELAFQSRAHQTSQFVFTDLKLNSNLVMWERIATCMSSVASKPRWIASVHVDADRPSGLDLATLKMIRAAGARRLTTGLESGSQRVLDSLAKGTCIDTTSRFLRDAAKAEISVRVD